MDDVGHLLERALAGDPKAVRRLVDRLTPVIQARVARALTRAGRAHGRNARQELEDLVQEVFAALFHADGRVLRSWRQERGLSLENFVGLVAEREVASVLRSGRRNPWSEDPTLMEELDAASPPVAAPSACIESKNLLSVLLQTLRAELSPKGLRLFELLIVREVPIEEVTRETGLEAGVLYTWRSRLRRHVQTTAERLEREQSERTSTGS